ncbi:MAG TPA: rod shape-determining protein MreC [Tepidiformaceae bacterium]
MLIFSRYTWWLGAMVGLAILLAIAGQVGLLSPFQGIFLTITSPVDRALTGVFEPVATFLSNAGNINSLESENRKLRLQNEGLQNTVTQLKQDSARITELEQALNISQAAGGGVHVAANIVNRESTPFTDVIAIDRGANDGIKNDMVVLSSQGSLIGTVTSTFPTTAFVRLVTDSKSKVAAQVLNSSTDGIVQGSANRALAFNLGQGNIKVGDTIVSSGLGGNYPAGLPIGNVSEVSGSPEDLSPKVKVEPTVRLSTAQTVLVLTSFTPQRISVPGQP